MQLRGRFNGPFPSADGCLRLGYGCTCDRCLAGIVSPRVASAMLFQAEVAHDQLTGKLDCDGKTWAKINDSLLAALPPRVHENLKPSKSMRNGYANMFSHVAECLRQKIVPAAENVLETNRNTSEWPPVTRNYLTRGGMVDTAFIM